MPEDHCTKQCLDYIFQISKEPRSLSKATTASSRKDYNIHSPRENEFPFEVTNRTPLLDNYNSTSEDGKD